MWKGHQWNSCCVYIVIEFILIANRFPVIHPEKKNQSTIKTPPNRMNGKKETSSIFVMVIKYNKLHDKIRRLSGFRFQTTLV
jgi:hypothetical protein